MRQKRIISICITICLVLTLSLTSESITRSAAPYLLEEYNFNNSTQGFKGRGSAQVSPSNYKGESVLYVTRRNNTWNGAQIDLTGILQTGKTYEISAQMLHKAKEYVMLDTSLEIKLSNGNVSYPGIASAITAPDTWQTLKETITVTDYSEVYLYFQITNDMSSDFYLKNITIHEIKKDVSKVLSYESMANLSSKYGFTFGTVINYNTAFDNDFKQILTKHFNTVTAANEMKAYALLDQTASQKNIQTGDKMPRMNFTKADTIMQIAKDNNIKVRGHVLVWEENMPDWFFRKGYDSNKAYASKKLIKKRLESYIKQVLQHFQTKFPNVIYAWDVVNEAVADNTGEYKSGDLSHIRALKGGKAPLFYKHLGKNYVKLSFEYARKYADKDVKLFYNDYNSFMPDKRDAICNLVKNLNSSKKLVDGVGMQSYMDMNDGYLKSYGDKESASFIDAVNMFSDLGVEVHLTELTVKNRDINQNIRHADYYESLFKSIIELNKSKTKITNISIWGLVDAPTAQQGSYTYQLSGTYFGLLDNMYQPKESFIRLYKLLK